MAKIILGSFLVVLVLIGSVIRIVNFTSSPGGNSTYNSSYLAGTIAGTCLLLALGGALIRAGIKDLGSNDDRGRRRRRDYDDYEDDYDDYDHRPRRRRRDGYDEFDEFEDEYGDRRDRRWR